MYQDGCKYLIEQLEFRNYLRSNDEEKIEYGQLKLELSVVNKNNKQKYTDEKVILLRVS